MKSDRQPRTPRLPDAASEARLLELRREAEQRGAVTSAGAKPAGAPFPQASPESGYYGLPLLKKPGWSWEVPVYFFVGGAAGASGDGATPQRALAAGANAFIPKPFSPAAVRRAVEKLIDAQY